MHHGIYNTISFESDVHKITEVYGKETYEFRENSIVVSIPFIKKMNFLDI